MIERVLFGSPPGDKILHEEDLGGNFPNNSDEVAHIDRTVARQRNGNVTYARNSHYFYDRTYPIQQVARRG